MQSSIDPKSAGPLAGLRVLELARLLPGPLAGRILADFGADVIKVEQPGRGDYSRSAPPFHDGMGIYFANVNRNKRSLALDITTPEGREVLLTLLQDADMLVESFRPGWMAEHALDYPQLASRFPGLIYCSVTGFGHSGPYRHWPGHDLGVVGMTGLMQLHGDRPELPPVQAADLAATWAAVSGLMMALWTRRESGHGQFVDVAMFDALNAWLPVSSVETYRKRYAAEPWDAGPDVGELAAPFGGSPRYRAYQTADGRWLTVALLEQSFWRRFCHHVGRSDLIDPLETEQDRLGSHPRHYRHWQEALEQIFASKPRDVWMEELSAIGVPCCPVYRMGEMLQDPQFQARQLLREIPTADGVQLTPGLPFALSETPGSIRLRAPRLGEHSTAVLQEAGIGQGCVERLVKAGVVQQA